MIGKVFALESDDMPDQQFSVLGGHPNKSSVESIGALRVGNRIHPEHFQRRCENYLVRQSQGTGQDLVFLKLIGECNTETAAADIDGSPDQCGFCRIRFPLQADRKRDRDAIVLSTIAS